MIPRPRFRLPIWAALTLVGAAYLLRSWVIRGGDFTLDLPDDAVVALVVIAGVLLVGITRRATDADEADDDARDEGQHEDGDA